ncbi:MAG: cytochrome c biogenesis protein CcsA [Gemmatimonas sp.]
MASTSAASAAAALRGTSTNRSSAGSGTDWFLVIAVLAVVGACLNALLFTPTELRQGLAQKIFYIHVPSAIMGLYFSVIPMAIVSGVYLWLKDERLDRIAESFAEVGLIFVATVLLTGPFWGKPIWGTYWQWEARLTSTLFLSFVLVGYLVMRNAIDQPEPRARLSAIIGIMAGCLVPFIHLSVYLFNTLHPMPVVIKPEKSGLSPEMGRSFLISLAAFFVLMIALVHNRYRWAQKRDRLQAMEDER